MTHFKQQRALLADRIELLENSVGEEKAAFLRTKLAKVDALLAALGMKQSDTIH